MDHAFDGLAREAPVKIPAGRQQLDADLGRPDAATGLVIFAHGSGSSRHSPRNRAVAAALWRNGFATLLLDLLTPAEEMVDDVTRAHRFDMPLLADRLVAAIDWAAQRPPTSGLPIGLFGASTGAAAALIAAAQRPAGVRCVVSRGGRPDLAGDALPHVRAPTLLLVGELDDVVIDLNRTAQAAMTAEVRLEIVPGATHLFPEPGALERVAALAGEWFTRFLTAAVELPVRGRPN